MTGFAAEHIGASGAAERVLSVEQERRRTIESARKVAGSLLDRNLAKDEEGRLVGYPERRESKFLLNHGWDVKIKKLYGGPHQDVKMLMRHIDENELGMIDSDTSRTVIGIAQGHGVESAVVYLGLEDEVVFFDLDNFDDYLKEMPAVNRLQEVMKIVDGAKPDEPSS